MLDTIPTLGQNVQVIRCDDGAIVNLGIVWGIFPESIGVVLDSTGECLNFIRRQPTSFKGDGYYLVKSGIRYRACPVE